MKPSSTLHRALTPAVAVTGLFTTMPAVRADAVTDWNANMVQAMKATALGAGAQGRFAAIVHVAIYDAVNGIQRKYTPYFVNGWGPRGASAEAAAIQAGYTTLSSLFPSQQAALDAQLEDSLSRIQGRMGRNRIARGQAWGESVANTILAWRAQDGFTTPLPGYFGSMEVGVWRSIPTATAADGTLPAVIAQVAVLPPFAMTSPSQFRPVPPYGLPLADALASAQYAADLNEAKAIGRIDSAIRTEEQTALARLWQASGPAEENNSLRQVVPRKNKLVDNARLFALANIVAADTIIAGFDSKYAYNFWRPHHAIRNANLDGNPATEADPEWSALFVAPRHQEYISNHAVFTPAFMHVLARELGNEHTFTLSSLDFPGYSWTFERFSDAGVQAKEARIWAGIHYRNSCDVGEVVGLNIANYVVDNFLRPLRKGHRNDKKDWNDKDRKEDRNDK